MKHVKKTQVVLVLFTLIAALLAACGAPPAPSVPTAESQLATPAAPSAQPTQSAQAVQATLPAPAIQPTQSAQPANMPGQDLGGYKWQWVTTSQKSGQTFTPSNPGSYTIEFSMTDGRVNITADCNNASGDFMTDGQSLQLMIGGATRTACPSGSLSDEFFNELSETGSYQVQGNSLTLTTTNGAMAFIGAAQAAAQPSSPAGATANLEGPTWNWINTAYTNGSTVAAPDPAKYTLKFDPAAKRFLFVSDCNNGSGSYSLSGQNLTLHVEGKTLASCPAPSDDYVKQLDQVASYKIGGSTLTIALQNGAGTMTFTTGETQSAPSVGSSGGTATPPAPTSTNLQRLTSSVWKWQQSADNTGQTWTSPNPANYTLQFNADGTLSVKVDCNSGSGTYQADESKLTMTLGATTLMACPPPTLDTIFQQQLGKVVAYGFDGDSLILLWQADGGSMKFSK